MQAVRSIQLSLSLLATGAVISTLILGTQKSASAATFKGTDAFGRQAEAAFRVNGKDLIVTLTNTSKNDVSVPTDVLTAVFFKLPGNQTLQVKSAKLANGSTVLFDTIAPQPVNGDVGGEWAYKSGLNVRGAKQGISSSGLSLFGPGDRFDTTVNLAGPDNPDGLQYGITSAGDDPTTGNTAVTGGTASNQAPLIKNSVQFILSASADLPWDFASDIMNVSFQYGTNLSEHSFGGELEVPEPGTIAGIALTLGGLAVSRRRQSQK
jgi:hypothetical protein